MYQSVSGSGVLIVGDLHFSDVYTGKHKNYLKNCFDALAKIRNRVLETKPAAVVFLGDVVGVNEGNVRSREVLNQLCSFFREIGEVSKVFCVRGNHDFNGSFPEFQFLSGLKLFETSASSDGYFDFFGTGKSRDNGDAPEVRFHLMDYGSENMKFDLAPEPAVNIVLGHNNFTIQGLTNWYQAHGGIELGTMENMQGIYMMISGHIHNPSPQIISTNMLVGGSCLLFYPGCPTRPSLEKNMYESTWFVEFKYDEDTGNTNYDAIEFPLSPISETFYSNEDFVEEKSEEELAEMERTTALKDVLDDILKCRIAQGDLVGQVKMIPNASEEAKAMAAQYLQIAIDSRAPAKK